MSSRQFTNESALFDALTSTLAPAFTDPGTIAVFDADGTLWREDASECLLSYLEGVGVLRPPHGWPSIRAYLSMLYQRSYRDACTYCATVFQDALVTDAIRWSEQSFRLSVQPSLVGLTERLVAWLQEKQAEVHVVSASPWWAIMPGTRALGIPDERVHALDLQVKHERFSAQIRGRLQSGRGKAETVAELGSAPAFVAGNTVDDAAMMRLATCTALAVEPLKLQDDTRNLENLASDAGWFVLK